MYSFREGMPVGSMESMVEEAVSQLTHMVDEMIQTVDRKLAGRADVLWLKDQNAKGRDILPVEVLIATIILGHCGNLGEKYLQVTI
jgi:hypothetical protein